MKAAPGFNSPSDGFENKAFVVPEIGIVGVLLDILVV